MTTFVEEDVSPRHLCRIFLYTHNSHWIGNWQLPYFHILHWHVSIWMRLQGNPKSPNFSISLLFCNGYPQNCNEFHASVRIFLAQSRGETRGREIDFSPLDPSLTTSFPLFLLLSCLWSTISPSLPPPLMSYHPQRVQHAPPASMGMLCSSFWCSGQLAISPTQGNGIFTQGKTLTWTIGFLQSLPVI